MKHLLLPLATCGAFAFTTVLAADFTLRPGRWEVTLDVKLPASMQQHMPATASASESSKPMVDCLSEAIALDRMLVQGVGETCKVDSHKQDGNVQRFTAHCEDSVIDYQIVRNGADSFTASGVTRSKNPQERLTFASTAKRTGASCSAQELAAYKARTSDE